MTDRDRLIELFGKIEYTPFPDMSMKSILKNQFTDYALNCIVDKLLDNGVIAPPCKVGDKVYVTDYPITGNKIFECTIDKISYHSYGTYYSLNWGRSIRRIKAFRSDSLGKTVFLSREEAEKALKERESNDR